MVLPAHQKGRPRSLPNEAKPAATRPRLVSFAALSSPFRWGSCKTLPKKRLIGMMPLQFCDFFDIPLQFSYSQPCHYNLLSTWLMPFSMAAATSGPPAGRRTHTILLYGRLCPSPTRIEPVDSVALTPWLSLARLAFPLPMNPNPRS